MLRLENINKTFPGVKALDNVTVEFNKGEVHGLLGENGAGKSTLINIICGIYKEYDGKMYIDNKLVKFKNFKDAVNMKISIVNQEIQVVPGSSIGENIVLDKLDKFSKNGKLNWKAINVFAKKYLEMVGLYISPEMKIGTLSAGKKQLIQIAKALSADAKILLLDEPTSSISKNETKNLFEIINKLKAMDVTIIFVSHKLDEVIEICDCISVLRDGKYAGAIDLNSTKTTNAEYKKDIIKMMIGRDTEELYLGKLDIEKDKKVVEVCDLCKDGMFKNINFHLNKGEILGFYGLVGAGRTELAKILIGEDNFNSGEVKINGITANIKSMADSLYKYKMGYISENRKEEGLILDETINTNIGITIWKTIKKKIIGLIDIKKEKEIVDNVIEKFDIKTPNNKQIVKNLSGGNQQKVSISKWIAANCKILIIDEPTVGVDVGAKENIHKIIWNLAKKENKSIIVISSDMPEIVTLARRILVFDSQKIVGEINELNDEQFDYKYVSSRIGEYIA